MITSAYSKTSNSSGFNAILQKFCEMICEIIVYKTVCGIFLIFSRSSFINNFIVKNHFLRSWNHRNWNISRSIYYQKISAHSFEDDICTNKLEESFFQKTFFQVLETFLRLQNHWFEPHFFPQKINIILFFKVWLLNFNTILKTCFTNLFRKTGSKSCKTPLKYLRKKFFKLHMLFLGTIPSGNFFNRLVM